MNEQLKKVIDPIRNFWGKLTKKTKIIIFSCLGAVVVLAVVLSLVMNRTQFTVLYPSLNSDEAKEVSTELNKLDVAYKVDNGTVYVDKNKENSVRMQLSNEGYPKSAPNYNFFTSNVGVMTTDEERKIIEQYQLQERLGAVVKTLDPVDTAYVTISVPASSGYAWDDNKQTPTASVALKLKEGRSLDSKQVNGIKQLVSKSVPSLKASDVSIVDSSSGEELSSSSSSSQSTGSTQITLSEFKLKIEKQYEDNVQNKILNLLAQTYGRDNVSVSVKSKMDLDKKIQDIVTYTPSTSDGKGMVSHSTETHEVTQQVSSGSGGVAGTQSNADTTTTYPGVTVNGNVITTKDSKTYNYLVNQVQEQIQSDAAALDDLSVAVMINTNTLTNARQQELSNLVAKAAAVDQSKVAVMAVPLASSANSQTQQTQGNLIPQALLNNPVILIAGGAFILLLILLIALIAAKKSRERREQLMANLQQASVPAQAEAYYPLEEEEEEDAEEEEMGESDAESEDDYEDLGEEDEEEEEDSMPTESIEELRNANNGKEQRFKGELQDFSFKNPEIAAQLIRSWLRGDDKHGG